MADSLRVNFISSANLYKAAAGSVPWGGGTDSCTSNMYSGRIIYIVYLLRVASNIHVHVTKKFCYYTCVHVNEIITIYLHVNTVHVYTVYMYTWHPSSHKKNKWGHLHVQYMYIHIQ